MKDWQKLYNDLPDSEKDKIAVLRVMECTNGVIQHAFRDGDKWALSVEETRTAMKFSMSCIKNMSIPLNTAPTISLGLPTPIKYLGLSLEKKSVE